MKKKLVFVGVGLLLAAVVLFIISGYILSSGFKKNVNLTSLTINADDFSYAQLSYNSSIAGIAIYALMSSPSNLYLLNSSLFTQWYDYMNQNRSVADGYQYARHIGVNSSYLFRNVSLQVIPVNLRSGSVPKNFSGKLYVVVDNTQGSKSSATSLNATLSYIPLGGSTIWTSAALGYGVLILGLAGIIIIIWGLVKKDEPGNLGGKDEAAKSQKEYVDKLYKGIKNKK
jgi:hypothetical protein